MQSIRWYYLLQILGSRPQTVLKLKHELEQLRIYAGVKTIQRDLNCLESIFMGIYSERSERQVYWYLDNSLPENIAQLKLKSQWNSKVTGAGMEPSNESNYKKRAA